jgi:hypothetical protein
MKLLKYKMYQKAGWNRPKEQRNIIYSSMCKNSIKFNRLAWHSSNLFLFQKEKSVKAYLKKIQEYQKHRKRQQKLNISDLESIFNASDKN